MKTLNVEVLGEYEKQVVTLDHYPDTCPICLHGMDPRLKFGYLEEFGRMLQVVFQCPRIDCHGVFIAYYFIMVGGIYSCQNLLPQTDNPREFDEHINTVSAEFVKLFNQAQHAEKLGMSEIAGPGYRKSLEFLIKDYAIFRHPEASDDIKIKLLSNVINEYVHDTRIKSTARRAAWLGNDETHYYRRWEEKDIKDLKILIELTVRWIESEELTRKYERDMTD